jgi:Tol biopolymer transport system component
MMMKVKRIGGVYPSPDGKRVAYTVREAVMDQSRSEYITQIHLADADGGNPVQLTRGSGSSDHPQWSPDGKFIAFLSDRSGKTNLWLIPVSGGEAEQLTDEKTNVSSFQWAPNSQMIAFTMLDAPTPEEEAAAKIKADVKVVDEKIKQNRLYLLILKKDESGKRQTKPMTPGDTNVVADGTGYDWSPGGDAGRGVVAEILAQRIAHRLRPQRQPGDLGRRWHGQCDRSAFRGDSGARGHARS